MDFKIQAQVMGKIINLKPQPLTTEKLRTFEGLENLTDEEATKILDTLTRLSILTYKFFNEHKEKNENQKIAA